MGSISEYKNNLKCKHVNYLICGMVFFVISVLFISCEVDTNYVPIEELETEANNAKNDSTSNWYDNSSINYSSDYDIAGSEEEINLLVNGGMEKWQMFSYDIPDGWLCHNNNNVRKEHKIVYEGQYSAKMQSRESGSTATVDQNIPVEPGGKIRIRFHYFVEQWKSKGARTYCYFRTRAAESSTISADELKEFYDKETYYVIRGGGYGLTYLPHDLNVWQVFDETIDVPPTATHFVFGVNSYYGTTIYVDDCWVIDVSEHFTTGIKPISL